MLGIFLRLRSLLYNHSLFLSQCDTTCLDFNSQYVKMIQSLRNAVKTLLRPQAFVKSKESSHRNIVHCRVNGVVSRKDTDIYILKYY